MKVLITGGSGYFGIVLRDHLRSMGRDVIIFDINDSPDRPGSVTFIQGDIRDLSAIQRICQGVQQVYHCVASVPLAKSDQLFESVNTTGTRNLLESALTAGVRKVVLLSSSAIYGIPIRNPVDGTMSPNPVESYGISKLRAELLAKDYILKGLDVSIVRPRTILGHGRLGIFSILFEWVSEGKKVYLMGSGNNIYQFIHADDLADACVRAADRVGPAEYNVGTNQYCSMKESIEGLLRHAGTGSRVVTLPFRLTAHSMEILSKMSLLPFAPYHWLMYGREFYFDTSQAQAELGWTPKWSNINMLCQSYDWYLANTFHLAKDPPASIHRSPVKEGLLSLLKWIS